ncbi:P-loop containing nucleoside triphosphate hydrolase protein [Aureobasidium subglaciale]|nr:P-loop containing nucleoside triphosphate hydrolase protein [Aureobasidium subglaciale]
MRPSLCPFCEAAASIVRPAFQMRSTRHMATTQKPRPSRMNLSPKVALPEAKAPRRRTNSPFGGMNVTHADFRHAPRQRPSSAEQKRATRNAPEKYKPKDDIKDKDPFKALKMQRALSPISYSHRSAVKQSIADAESFDQFGLLPSVHQSISAQALKGLDDTSPTPIQRLAIPALLGTSNRRSKDSNVMQQYLLAAETGSGKTLAYLLPVIDALKRAEMAQAEEDAQVEKETAARKNMFALESPPLSNEPHPTTGRPRAIILVPTAELVQQVGALAKSLSHTTKFRAALISANFTGTVIRNRLFSPAGVDLLICTPHLLASISENDPNVLSRVTHMVVDEADSLLDRSFAPITGSILDRATPSLKQLVLCSATIPRSLDSHLRKRFPDIRRLATPNLHAIPRRVQLSVVDVEKDPYKGNRDLACADTVWNLGREAGEDAVKRVIVFVNEREKCSELSLYLQSKGVDALALSRDSDERKQAQTLAEFTGAVIDSRASQAQAKVLVMTDLGSRGIDTLMVRNVILYDVPHTSIDFIHRLGRVGRMGRRGRGFVLVGKGDRRDIVKEVREGMFTGSALI